MTIATMAETEVLRMVNHDLYKAQVLFDKEQGLPYWAWCALIGQWTGTQTWLRCKDGMRLPLWGPTVGMKGERHYGLHYEKPTTIASWDSEWHRASNGNMRDWILLLAQEADRINCLRVHRSYHEDGPEELPQALLEARSRIMRKLERLTNHPKQLPGLSVVAGVALTMTPEIEPARTYSQDEMTQVERRMETLKAELELLKRQARREANVV